MAMKFSRGFVFSNAVAALGKKVNLQLLNKRAAFRQLIFSLCSSSTRAGVEQLRLFGRFTQWP
jgi:hypothetical protein